MTGGARHAPPLTYRDAGVDIATKSRLLAGLAPAIAATQSDVVAAGIGAFAGAMQLSAGDASFLVATVDGVGTKTLLARRLGCDAVIGGDIVAHCANDLVCQGARPLAFLDYIAMGRLSPSVVETLVRAMTDACGALGVALLGGETAEMPDVYAGDAYDVVGTMIGIAPPEGLVTGEAIGPGHRLISLASTGLHTNGYSLARRVLERESAVLVHQYIAELGTTVGEALLAPHRCYAPAVLSLFGQLRVRGLAHITGGGLVDNLTRILPKGCRARIARSWPEPPIFRWLQRIGRISDDEMIATFNLGIGMIVVVPARDIEQALDHFARFEIPAGEIGEVVDGPAGVEFA